MENVFESLFCNRTPRLVGLVGNSGSGKTMAASEVVRSRYVRSFLETALYGYMLTKMHTGALRP